MKWPASSSNSVVPARLVSGGAEQGATKDEDQSITCTLDSIDIPLGLPNQDSSFLVDHRCVKIGRVLAQRPDYVVFEGMCNTSPVAVKVMQPVKASDASAYQRELFQRKVTLLSNMNHEGIVKFVGATIEPTMMLMSELMRGGTIEDHLFTIRPNLLDLKHSLTYALDISKAMEYLHLSGIVHRDLKPSSILLNKEKTRAKLADFGIGREITSDMNSEVGSYRWMAPELFNLDRYSAGRWKRYDHKVDVYSFSFVLWGLLANEIPFEGMSNIKAAYATAKRLRPDLDCVPREIVPLLMSCWLDNPRSRPEFRDVTEILHTLYYSLYPPAVKPKPPPTPRAFNFGFPFPFPFTCDDFDIDYDIVNDNDNDIDIDIINNGNDNSNDSGNNVEETPEEVNQAAPTQVKKKSKPFLLRCFSCTHVSE